MKFVLLFLGMLIVTPAYANCVNVPDREILININKISAPVFDAGGKELKGCLLHSAGKVLGYSRDNRLCSAPAQNVKVRLYSGCCDTGPDFGDVECIVRSASFLGSGIGAAHGNGIIVNSAKP
jgi:hypothetical protein